MSAWPKLELGGTTLELSIRTILPIRRTRMRLTTRMFLRIPPPYGELAARALRASPLEEGALRLLALVADADGNSTRALSLMHLAAAQSHRDVRVQTWLLDERLMAGDLPGALQNIDATLRTFPEAQQLLLPILAGLASDPDAAKLVIDTVEKDPPWRGWFLSTLPSQFSEAEPLEAFLAGLREGATPPDIGELRPFISRLIELGDLQRAYALRREVSPGDIQGAVPTLNNGAFESPINGLPFGWVISPIRGANTQVVSETSSNKALRIQFYNTRVPYRNVSQLLLLEPGAYNLSGRVRAAALANDRGLQWTISCYAGKKDKLGETERVSGTMAWREFSVAFAVPAEEDCKAQILQLALPARVPAEQKISGEIWFDDLAITRADQVLAE